MRPFFSFFEPTLYQMFDGHDRRGVVLVQDDLQAVGQRVRLDLKLRDLGLTVLRPCRGERHKGQQENRRRGGQSGESWHDW